FDVFRTGQILSDLHDIGDGHLGFRQQVHDILPGNLGLARSAVRQAAGRRKPWCSGGDEPTHVWTDCDSVAVFANLTGDTDIVDRMVHSLSSSSEVNSCRIIN